MQKSFEGLSSISMPEELDSPVDKSYDGGELLAAMVLAAFNASCSGRITELECTRLLRI